MKLPITNNLILIGLIFVSLLFFSGCYTQLAKPDSNRAVQDTYTEESVDYYEDEEYGEEDEDYEDYEDYEEGDIEDYDEVHITRKYYNDIYVYGGYPSPWYYDPFYDPYFYDSYAPYSSHVSIHIGYRDPFFIGYHRRYYDPFYDPFFSGYYGSRYSFGYTSGFYFGRAKTAPICSLDGRLGAFFAARSIIKNNHFNNFAFIINMNTQFHHPMHAFFLFFFRIFRENPGDRFRRGDVCSADSGNTRRIVKNIRIFKRGFLNGGIFRNGFIF